MASTVKSAAAGVLMLATVLACSEPDPSPTPAKAVRAVTPTTLTGTVGEKVTGGITVRVVDYADRAKPDAKVTFTVKDGDGSVAARLVVTDADGLAHTDWTLGETAGANEVTAGVYGVDPDSNATFKADGAAGAAAGLSVTPRTLRIPSTTATGTLTTRVVDKFGNVVGGTPTYTSRNGAVVTVSSSGTVTANESNRGTSTWIVTAASGFTDSAQVFNMSSADPACIGISAMAALAVGEVKISGFADNGICVPAAAGEREYALVPFYETPLASSQTVVTVNGVGVKGTSSGTLGALRDRGSVLAATESSGAFAGRAALDRRLRLAERREMPARAAGARQWLSARAARPRATRAVAVPVVGDVMQLNVNAVDFCAAPSMRTGRVVAVTSKAVVVVDNANPVGLADSEYAALGVTFDTLVFATTATNFGAPTDIDMNGDRVVIFFTHAVNELGPGTLGFAYSRDLLPKEGPLGSCPGSNVAELINIYVPDATTSGAEVKVNAVATMGHELQHVINAARRLYVNTAAAPAEELWLNEGLSHVAEELLFYRSSGLTPRQNIGEQVSQAPYQTAYTNYQRQNFARYFRFTRTPGIQGPVGLTDDDDDLETRGAIWSFLRFAADQRFAGNEAAFWQSLVNANSTGLQNLYEHVGADTRLLIRDWALSNYLDDLVTTDEKYRQPSCRLRSLPGFQSPVVLNLVPSTQTTATTASATVTLRSLSSEFVRFGVGANQEAYINATGFPASANTPLPRRVLLAIVRTK